jgi:transposase
MVPMLPMLVPEIISIDAAANEAWNNSTGSFRSVN